MQKRRKQRTWYLCIMMICIIMAPTFIYGKSNIPSTIRVGLRSAYANVSRVEIKNTQLEVGYEQNDKFIAGGTLNSNTGFVIKANAIQHYTDGNVFSTYDEAAYALLDYKTNGIDAVVAYISPKVWQIYSTQNINGMNVVNHSGLGIRVEDGSGYTLLVCENDTTPVNFAGVDSNNSFSLTELTRGKYRGWFEFLRQGDKITAVNIVDFEEYLYGVVPAEMPASWNMEALKAQALAARSMSIYQSNKYIASGYNVCDTTMTQVYKGFSGEHPRTNQAVDETRGELVIYNGKIAETLFYSTSGGYTEDPIYVWGGSYPYLKAIPDPYETEPEGKPWTRTITLSDIDLCLSRQNINIGTAKGINVVSYTPAGRVNELHIIGTNGVHKITREAIRTFFTYTAGGSLRSRMFSIENAIIPSTPSTSVDGSKIVIEAANGVIGTKNVQEIQIIDGSGKITTANSSMVVEGRSGRTTYAVSVNNNALPTTGEYYGDIILSGRGYGHGVGMSQSGARGMAKAGYTYDQIIEYYYQGVSIER